MQPNCHNLFNPTSEVDLRGWITLKIKWAGRPAHLISLLYTWTCYVQVTISSARYPIVLGAVEVDQEVIESAPSDFRMLVVVVQQMA